MRNYANTSRAFFTISKKDGLKTANLYLAEPKIKIISDKNEKKKLFCYCCKHDVFIRDENAEIMWD